MILGQTVKNMSDLSPVYLEYTLDGIHKQEPIAPNRSITLPVRASVVRATFGDRAPAEVQINGLHEESIDTLLDLINERVDQFEHRVIYHMGSIMPSTDESTKSYCQGEVRACQVFRKIIEEIRNVRDASGSKSGSANSNNAEVSADGESVSSN